MSKTIKISLALAVLALILFGVISLFLNTADASSVENSDEKQKKGEILAIPKVLTPTNSQLAPNEYTTDNYQQPKYDPFNNKYRPYHEFEEKITPGDRAANTAPTAKFYVRTKPNSLADKNSGTVKTQFIFDAYASSDAQNRNADLKVRWDFESDGEIDSYFSTTKKITHQYDKPGEYTVTLEVMDEGGLIGRAEDTVTVVNNTEPFAHFTYSPTTGTAPEIITFKTAESYDSQYQDYYLEYRFDWDGDGIWDTPYKQKTIWKHQFGTPGQYRIFMEAKDPEGATDVARANVTIIENTKPQAIFTVSTEQIRTAAGYNGEPDTYRTKYYFDGSNSIDKETPQKLKYRWDFNYTGSDDIQFDTQWASYAKQNGFYDFSGAKTVRLQVMDEDGAVDTAYATFNVD